MMKLLLVLPALLASALPITNARRTVGILGGYKPTHLTEDLEDFLIAALQDETLYKSDVRYRVCVDEVISVSQQVVAGTNYRFEISGCDIITTLEEQSPVGRAVSNADISKQLGVCSTQMTKLCDMETIYVTVYDQPWTDTVQVTKIEFES